MRGHRLRHQGSIACFVLMLVLTGCGVRPDETNQRRIVHLIEEDLGAVYEFRYLPEHSRCCVEFTCWVAPAEGPAQFYRGTYGVGRIDLSLMEPGAPP